MSIVINCENIYLRLLRQTISKNLTRTYCTFSWIQNNVPEEVVCGGEGGKGEGDLCVVGAMSQSLSPSRSISPCPAPDVSLASFLMTGMYVYMQVMIYKV